MGRDYGQRDTGGRQTRGKPALPGWLWLLAGVAIGVGGAAAWYISRPVAPAEPVAAAEDKARTNGRKKIEVPPKEASRFTFYELLPKYEVVVPKETLKQAPKPTTPAANGAAATGARFVIQVGSFRARGEAEQQKANLALLGIESQIESVTINDRDTWYRVRIGPERGEKQVQSILARLDENQIDALVVRVPD